MEDINARGLFEEEILHKLLNDGSYFGSVVPLMKPRFFSDVGNSALFEKMKNFYTQTGDKPTFKDLVVMIKDDPKSTQAVEVEALKKIKNSDTHINEKLLLEKTEDFIRKAIHTESLILGAEAMSENNNEKLAESFAIAEIAQKVTLDNDFGTSVEDLDYCLDYYQDDTQGFLPNIGTFDFMLGRGFLPKTLHTFLAPPGVGKSASLSAFACQFLTQQLDVVVFTLEMDEAEWMKRIYANILNMDITTLDTENKTNTKNIFDNIKHDLGTLVVKEYPSYSVSPIQIQNYLEKYAVKLAKDRSTPEKEVTPEDIFSNMVVFVDYLGLLSSSRMATGTSSYEYMKSVTAELRGVAQKLYIPILTAHQLNRQAIGNVEAGQETVSDSAGISMFSDSMIMLLQTKEMKETGTLKVNFEKNRMTGKTFPVEMGFDYNKMRFVDRYYEENMSKYGGNVIYSNQKTTPKTTPKTAEDLKGENITQPIPNMDIGVFGGKSQNANVTVGDDTSIETNNPSNPTKKEAKSSLDEALDKELEGLFDDIEIA